MLSKAILEAFPEYAELINQLDALIAQLSG